MCLKSDGPSGRMGHVQGIFQNHTKQYVLKYAPHLWNPSVEYGMPLKIHFHHDLWLNGSALHQSLYVYIQTLKCLKLLHGVDGPAETQDVQCGLRFQ